MTVMDIDPFADLESLDVTVPDFPEEDHSSTDSTPDGPLCEVCADVIPWSGRGRKPKYCADHKRRTTPRDTGDVAPRAPRKSAKTEARLAELESDLTRELSLLGKGASFMLPVFGVTMVDRSARTAKALTRIAARNPKVLEALEVSTKVVDAFDLGEVGLALGVAIMVDLKRMNPDGALPQMTGVTEIYHVINDEETPTPEASAQRSGNTINPFEVTTPPRFAEVR